MSVLFYRPKFIVPSSVTVNTGGTPVGTVANVQAPFDGSVYQVPEVTGTPGYDIQFDFTGTVNEIYGVSMRYRYDGLASHDVTTRLYDYVAAADQEVDRISHTDTHYLYRTILFPDNDANFINGSNNSQLTVYHESSGNAAHDVYIDYVAIIGR